MHEHKTRLSLARADAPLARYRYDVAYGGFIFDPEQERVVRVAQRIFDELAATSVAERWHERWLRAARFGAAPVPVKGMYLYGGVGRGKTYIVDTLQDCLGEGQSRRVHFHRFMQSIHDELKRLKRRRDPLAEIAANWSEETRLLCMDEFHVTDIADAMLLGRLIRHLNARSVVLVATSNIAPDDLYAGGLQRQRFLPTIELIKRTMEVIAMDAGADYRLRALTRARMYHWPLNAESAAALVNSFADLTVGQQVAYEPLTVLGREIEVERVSEGVAWFEFDQLCRGARSTADYIEIARCHHSVLLSGVPHLSDDDPDPVVRFVNMVDEFYDRHVNLLISSAAPVAELYRGERYAQRFERTHSRLAEMQSREYLAREHLP